MQETHAQACEHTIQTHINTHAHTVFISDSIPNGLNLDLRAVINSWNIHPTLLKSPLRTFHCGGIFK